jgi:hypothetical protein
VKNTRGCDEEQEQEPAENCPYSIRDSTHERDYKSFTRRVKTNMLTVLHCI